jgi:hypothetical protein
LLTAGRLGGSAVMVAVVVVVYDTEGEGKRERFWRRRQYKPSSIPTPSISSQVPPPSSAIPQPLADTAGRAGSKLPSCAPILGTNIKPRLHSSTVSTDRRPSAASHSGHLNLSKTKPLPPIFRFHSFPEYCNLQFHAGPLSGRFFSCGRRFKAIILAVASHRHVIVTPRRRCDRKRSRPTTPTAAPNATATPPSSRPTSQTLQPTTPDVGLTSILTLMHPLFYPNVDLVTRWEGAHEADSER